MYQLGNLSGAAGQPVVSHAARDRGRGFGHVEAVHLGRDGASLGELPGISQAGGMAEKKVAIQGDDHPGGLEVVARLQERAAIAAELDVVPVAGLVLVPFGPRILGQKLLDLRGLSGGGDRLRQQAQARPAFGRLFGQGRYQIGQKLLPTARLAGAQDGLGAIGIVQLEHGRLLKNARRAQAHRVVRVAFDFCRPALVTFHQETRGIAADGHRGRVLQRNA